MSADVSPERRQEILSAFNCYDESAAIDTIAQSMTVSQLEAAVKWELCILDAAFRLVIPDNPHTVH